MSNPIINKLSQPKDGQIGDGVYTAYEWRGDPIDRDLVRIYIGTKQAGPILQYVADGNDLWDGRNRCTFEGGAWTPLYSHGNYGRNYVYGGTWTGHSLAIHPSIQSAYNYARKDEHVGDITRIGKDITILPKGIKGEVSLTSLDCSGSWSIWYQSALEALDNKLTRRQIQDLHLPHNGQDHLWRNETDEVMLRVHETVETYNI